MKNNRAPLLSINKLYASFHHHMWIQTGVTVRKRLNWVLTSVTLTFDLWPWPFAWTLLLSLVITPENFMMIQWWEHGEKGVTDGQTDGRTDGWTDRQTDWTSHIAAWSQLKTKALWGESRGFCSQRDNNAEIFPCLELIMMRPWHVSDWHPIALPAGSLVPHLLGFPGFVCNWQLTELTYSGVGLHYQWPIANISHRIINCFVSTYNIYMHGTNIFSIPRSVIII